MREIGLVWILIAGLWGSSQVWATEMPAPAPTNPLPAPATIETELITISGGSTGVAPQDQTPETAPTKENDLNCKTIPEDLKAMRDAQSFMLESMVRKNTSLAETLELFAKDFSSKKGKLKKTDFQKLKGSAAAFRGHAQREKGLVTRFDSTTEELIARVQKCLESGPLASQ